MRVRIEDPLHLLAFQVASGIDPVGRSTDGATADFDLDRDETDWPGLIRLAQQHGLGPLLLSALQRRQDSPFERSLLAPLQTERAQVAVHHVLAARAQCEVEAAFRRADIPAIWLKGIVLARTVYASPELRPMVDVDVLVPYGRREQALAMAVTQGFHLDRPQLFDGREGLKHHYYLESKQLRPIALELHFRLLGALDRLLSLEDQEWFWHNTMMQRLASDERYLVLRPEAHLIYLCAHAMLQHSEADLRLLRLADLDRLIAVSPDFDWSLVLEGATRMRWTYAVGRALALAQEYFHTALPSGLLFELQDLRPDTEDEGRARRRQVQRTKTQVVLDDLVAMSWSSRVRAAARIVVPPPRYMRWRYGLNSNRGLPGAYLRRLRRIGSDVLHSMGNKRKAR